MGKYIKDVLQNIVSQFDFNIKNVKGSFKMNGMEGEQR